MNQIRQIYSSTEHWHVLLGLFWLQMTIPIQGNQSLTAFAFNISGMILTLLALLKCQGWMNQHCLIPTILGLSHNYNPASRNITIGFLYKIPLTSYFMTSSKVPHLESKSLWKKKGIEKKQIGQNTPIFSKELSFLMAHTTASSTKLG